MELINKTKIACCFVFLLLLTYNVNADYIGPFTVVEGGWGKGDMEFGIEHQDTADTFPKIFTINRSRNIFIIDGHNKRVKFFDHNGSLINVIKPINAKRTKYLWPSVVGCDSENSIYTSNYDNKLQKYKSDGTLIWEKGVFVGSIHVLFDNSVIVYGHRENRKDLDKFLHFSPSGKLLKGYGEKPLELGQI